MKTAVAHLVRRYLSPTETFIANQISSLNAFEPIVLCHARRSGHNFPCDEVHCVSDVLSGMAKIKAKCAYSLFRHITHEEVQVLEEIVKTRNIRLLHFHYAVDARYFSPIIKHLNLPSLVSLYGYDVSSFPRMFFGYGKRYIEPVFRTVDICLAMSEDMKKDLVLLGCPERKIIVHYHGVDTSRFRFPDRQYANRNRVHLLMCGTLEMKKAQHLVLRALRSLEGRECLKIPFHLTLIGDGPMRKRLEKMVTDFRWSDQVSFLGHIPHRDERLVGEYRKADIFLLPSITVRGDKEGIPGTIVEAMAAGLPVISTYHAGIPEIINNNEDGVLVDEGDVEKLAEAIVRVSNDPELRKRYGTAAACKARLLHDLVLRTRNLEAIYNSLLG